MEAAVVTKDQDVAGRLNQLGLTLEVLAEAVRLGEARRADCTPNHPKNLPGFIGWGEIVRELRDRLLPHGWKRCSAGGLETVVSPDCKIAIAVRNGDDATGLAHRNPKPTHPFGTTLKDAAICNQITISCLDPKDELEELPAGCLTWVLLVHSSEHEVRSELSLPILGEDRSPPEWESRIILPPIVKDATRLIQTPETEPSIEIKLERRAE